MNPSEPEDSSPSSRAAMARLDVALHELAGIGPAPALEARVLAAFAAAPIRSRALLPPQWLLTASVLLGLLVVGTVAWLQRHSASQQATAPMPQDPPPAPAPPPTPAPTPPNPQPALPTERGTTWIASYSENLVVAFDAAGKEIARLEDMFGVWDVEPIAGGRVLVTEFALSQVREIDLATKQTVWKFKQLRNPYDADRLPNGNTLIADTFADRVIEVDAKGTIVWSFDKEIRPFDCDRLDNGNTLIADVRKDRILEVDPKGEVVWQLRGMPSPHDADRLPNGNTLVTLRNKNSVVEVDRDGKVVSELTGLLGPSDADRLPNGNTLVAESHQVREFDPRGVEVWKKEMTWAVEVCRQAR
ncbi:MAG: aryl-sulfate sulfotransferase [Planctomycetes bacterium]|nr:aryl-sulfate sulfotransferase [Planctomycetota bacterium]